MARQRGTQATDPTLKSMFEEIADHWLALAEQADWLERQAPAETVAKEPKKEGEPPA